MIVPLSAVPRDKEIRICLNDELHSAWELLKPQEFFLVCGQVSTETIENINQMNQCKIIHESRIL